MGATSALVGFVLLVQGAGVASAATEPDVDLERLEAAEITAEMLSSAVIDLGEIAVESVLPLDAAASVTGFETTEEKGGKAVVTLTSDLLFEFGQAALTPAAATAIPELVAGIAQGAAVAVDGYTDSLGGDTINVPLSEQRAQAVAATLAAARPDLVLTVAGHGSAAEVAPNTVGGGDNPAGRALNRRVELTYAGA
ncbi:OmpA family protein [Pengzhenrongella phosphoraccumulans]|uniref:OmpA family protein n=1 Tax=Pengzhenrongella phosphoraccumulans TaxID=3114394 RepID=UPI00388ED1AA